MKLLFNIGLAAAAIYFYSKNQFIVSSFFILFIIIFYIVAGLKRSVIVNYALKNTNAQLSITYNLEKLLQRSSVMSAVLCELHKQGILNEINDEKELIDILICNYKKLYEKILHKEDNKTIPVETLVYKFINGLSWKNDILYKIDAIYHRIVLPYYVGDGLDITEAGLGKIIERHLLVDMCMINGFLCFRIGPFDSGHYDYSFKMLYSFPLVYMQPCCIPSNYLNFLNIFKDKPKGLFRKFLNTIDHERVVNLYTYFFIQKTTNYSSGYGRIFYKQRDKFFKSRIRKFANENGMYISDGHNYVSNDIFSIYLSDFTCTDATDKGPLDFDSAWISTTGSQLP